MARFAGLWVLLIVMWFPVHAWAFDSSLAGKNPHQIQDKSSFRQFPIGILLHRERTIQSDVLAKIEMISCEDELKFMKTFNLGELKVLPYAPSCQPKSSAKSQAYFSFKLPDICGGVNVKTGLCYHLAENQKNGIGSREQVLYLVSTKSLNETKWKPFVSLSFMRSEVRGAPRIFNRGLQEIKNCSAINYKGPEERSRQAVYSDVQVLETCCGLRPHEKLSLVFSFNCFKPLGKKGIRLNTSTAKLFDDVKMKRQSQGVDLKVDYTLREGLNLLVKSEYLLSHGSLREKEDKPVLIEGQLIVSF